MNITRFFFFSNNYTGLKNAPSGLFLDIAIFLFVLISRCCPVNVGDLGRESPNLETWN